MVKAESCVLKTTISVICITCDCDEACGQNYNVHADWQVSGASFLAPENLCKLHVHTKQVSCSRKWLHK